ncbi:hypothetical protein B0I37DRAFT_364287 [Chaetomium sp. MPI-CAGE-AT-0009]|nr:hypothetical protein B0I37DRAFT_364287 [Chaetomium sp. MPI-CAGE-AT-0009]
MSGRGRGRPPSRSAQEPAAGSSRRSTRQQQQHQNVPEPEEPQQHLDSPEQQHQEQQPQDGQQLTHGLDPQLEDPMSAALYNTVIDPAISGPQDGGMPPPPVPSAKSIRGQDGPYPRRHTRRSDNPSSDLGTIMSVAPTDALSSQQEPQSTALDRPASGLILGPRGRAPSIVSSTTDGTPGREAARARLMTAMLSRLFTAADDFFVHLCSEQTNQEMWEVERNGFKKAFEAYRTYYLRDDGDPVVNPAFVTDVMRLEKASLLWYKVVRVVSAANLTMLLGDITPSIPEPSLEWVLNILESDFPDSFIGEGSVNADNAMNQQIIEQILMIRTQLTIFHLKKLVKDNSEPFHPRLHVAKIWCDGDVSVESIEAFLGNNNDGLQLKPIAPAKPEVVALARDRNAVPTRFGSICKMLPDQEVDGDGLDLSQFETLYPLPDFVDNLQSFVKSCFESIKFQLQQESVHSSATSRADSQIRSQLEADTIGQAFDRADLDVQPAFNMNSLRMLKQLEQQGASVYGDNQLPPGSYAPAPRIPYPPGFSSPSHALGYGDPAQQGGFQPPGSIYAESAAQALGRKRQAQGEPSTGNGTAGSAGPPAKKTRVRRKKNGVPEATMGPPSTGAPGSAPVAPSAALSQYPPLPGTQDEPDFDALSQRTREITAASRKVKEPQVRSGWVRRDILLLVKAVNTYQCKWSTIEKEIKAGTIPFERPRDQQALRDKARLLKQDFLKTDTLLPRGFDLVVLGKKEKEAVRSVGKNPDRKEDDVDENGQPINTEYNPEVVAASGALLGQLPAVDSRPEQQLQPAPEPQPEPEQAGPEQIAAA